MKSLVAQVLQESLIEVESMRTTWTDAIARLKKDGGDPAKLERYEGWLAKNVETSIQIRELLEGSGGNGEE